MRKVYIIGAGVIFLIGIFFFVAGFFKRQAAQQQKKLPQVQLTYYRFGESSESILKQIQAYQKTHPNVKVAIQEFYDLDQYEDTLLNEMAAGGGPDIFSMPNEWIYKHQNKISPLPEQLMTVDDFRKTFVEVADRDFAKPDATGNIHIYGIPLYVDSLAVYYNKQQFEDRLSSRGTFAVTWDQFAQDVYKLTKLNNNTIEVAGAALGRADNISLGLDVLYSLMLQMRTQFYDPQYKQAIFAASQKGSDGKSSVPGIGALTFFTSFSQPLEKNYTWSKSLTTPGGDEIDAFAQGKVSVIFGYSDTYGKIVKAIGDQRALKHSVIDPTNIQTSYFPQVEDPEISTQGRLVLANYFAETVSRNSKYSLNAWNLIKFLSEKDSEQTYHAYTHKPASRRDLIDEQKKEPLYGVFAEQSAFATSAPIYDWKKFHEIFSTVVQKVADGNETPSFALKQAQEAVTQSLPKNGFIGPGPYQIPAQQSKK